MDQDMNEVLWLFDRLWLRGDFILTLRLVVSDAISASYNVQTLSISWASICFGSMINFGGNGLCWIRFVCIMDFWFCVLELRINLYLPCQHHHVASGLWTQLLLRFLMAVRSLSWNCVSCCCYCCQKVAVVSCQRFMIIADSVVVRMVLIVIVGVLPVLPSVSYCWRSCWCDMFLIIARMFWYVWW